MSHPSGPLDRNGDRAPDTAAQAHADALKDTPLTALHAASGARLVPFAGHKMPLQFEGILAEHVATREGAGVFDVSHMGQLALDAPSYEAAARWLEHLTPANLVGLAEGRARYGVLTNADGGIVDDFIATRLGEELRLVVNGSRREAVAAHFAAHADPSVSVTALARALVAVQGPTAEAVLAPFVDADLATLPYMGATRATAFGVPATVARCGYTGEDGFEISLPPEAAPDAWQALLKDGRAKPVGLGARDTLRLEAGLCLYGQDLDEDVSPVEADLLFTLAKRRREAGDFLGSERILAELADGPSRRRVGLSLEGRVPARAGAEIRAGEAPVGRVTSGGVGPTVGHPVAMGFVAPAHAEPGTHLEVLVRGRTLPATVVPLPFLKPNVRRKP